MTMRCRPCAKELEERFVADLDAKRMQRERAALVDLNSEEIVLRWWDDWGRDLGP